MRLRTLYLLVALVLGTLAGLAVALEVFALAAGVLWLFLFGDDAWPAGVEGFLLGLPAAAGVATLAACLAVGFVLGRRHETGPQPERLRRRAYRLLWAGLALWLLIAALAGWRTERDAAARATAGEQEAAYGELLRARHAISDILVRHEGAAGDEVLRLSLDLAGTRGGAYRLAWSVEDRVYDVVLDSGERRLDLAAGAASFDLSIERAALARRYRATVLEGRPDKVLVDGTFRVTLWLEPLLTDAERTALPARELGKLERGFSDLRSEAQVDLPLSLDLTKP